MDGDMVSNLVFIGSFVITVENAAAVIADCVSEQCMPPLLELEPGSLDAPAMTGPAKIFAVQVRISMAGASIM